MMIPSSSLARFLTLCCCLWTTTAHRPAVNGPGSCDNDYGSSTTALPLADPLISWSFKHYLDCTHRAVWIETVNPNPNQPFYVGVGLPPVDRQSEVRADALVIGPGLPTLTDAEWALLPEEIRNDPVWSSGDNIGAYFHQSPQDQSTCGHLGTVMQESSTVVDGRCDFYEPFGKTHSWRVLDADNNLLVEEGATYHVAVWLQDNTSAKIGIALGTWVENFIAPYAIDTPTCTRDLSDFSEKNGLQDECFPVVSCPTAQRPIGCESAEAVEAPVCELGQTCEETVESCEVAGISYTAPTMGACGGERCPAAVRTWEQINAGMHQGMMDIEYTGNADIDFVRGMIPHHNGAVDMCQGLIQDLTCTPIEDIDNLEGMVHFCNHIQLEQDIEVTGMRKWLAERNLTELAPCGNTFVDEDTVALSMRQESNNTGGMTMSMAESCGDLSTPSSQSLIDVNHKMHELMAVQYSCDHTVDFVRMMLPHHAGAVDMCDILLETTADDYLIELCDNITLTQRAEIAWMNDWLEARDHAPVAPCSEDCMAMNDMTWTPPPCEDILSTSSFCHGINGMATDGYCRCDEETFAANNYTCDQPTWVDGVGLFVPEVFCKRTCGMCTAESRPLWVPGCDGGHDGHSMMEHGEEMHAHHGDSMHDEHGEGDMHGDHAEMIDEGNRMVSESSSASTVLSSTLLLLALSSIALAAEML